MTWVKLDDNFPDNRKLLNVSDSAKWLYVAGLCYCGRNLTDGYIPTGHALRLTETATAALAAQLEDAGLWDAVEDGWMVPDFLAYNPSREKVLAERAAAAERKERWKERRSERRGNGVPNAVRNASPTRPDPTRPEGSGVGESEATEPLPAPEAVRANVPHVRAVREHLKAVGE